MGLVGTVPAFILLCIPLPARRPYFPAWAEAEVRGHVAAGRNQAGLFSSGISSTMPN
jgi:hypothetical protein